ncbi:hypothetical protein SRB5_62290 [Streptomyces sp. RB5]|uniref:PucR C-terminal helix-turn-helix domain-containing protein n=1 Tax=Streptomyces smaragdinus TaxID=2585196 RepID=A0A7K0CRB7_9ACTN|nr:helix-turn-helix domain-containing protein [Streptomyces smaragdinus]MQY16037.1 hypothetical protein [Streptomyces smaragdinus]
MPVTEPSGLSQPPEPLPQELAAVMRPELPSLIADISREIGRVVPEYGHLLAGPYGRMVQDGVGQSLSVFVDEVAHPGTALALRDEVCRRLGRFEAFEGRDFQVLRTALRTGARVALRRARTVAARYQIAPALIAMFADAVFAYIDEIEVLCHRSYLEALSTPGEEQGALRRRLLRLVVAGGSTPGHPAVVDLADESGWALPEEATPVALTPGMGLDRAALDTDVLAEEEGTQPHLLVPGPLDDARQRMLLEAAQGRPTAAGLTVPLAETDDSLRWARQLLELARTGLIEAEPLLRAERHLVTLLLLSDPALVEVLARQELAPLDGLTPVRQGRMLETLRVWLTTRGTAAAVAEDLGVHPQTVRYRLRNLGHSFGNRLQEPDRRFAIEVALRALRLREGADGADDGTDPGKRAAGAAGPG